MRPYKIFPTMITVGWTVLLQNFSHNYNHNHNRVSISGFLPHSQHWFHWPSYPEHGGTQRGISSPRGIHHAAKSLCYWGYLGLPVGSSGGPAAQLQQCQHVRTMQILSHFYKCITCSGCLRSSWLRVRSNQTHRFIHARSSEPLREVERRTWQWCWSFPSQEQ